MKAFISSCMLLLHALVLLILTSCGRKTEQSSKAPPPLQSFKTLELTARNTTLYMSFPAVLRGKENVEIRPKVEGFVEEIYIDEGSVVKKGQPLFRISAPLYEQQMRNYAALVASAEADVNTAELQVTKTRPLVEKEIISSYELDFAVNALKARRAALLQARANLDNAKTNVGYTHIVSPVDGIAGELPYKTGSLVSSASPQPLTTISGNGSVYAYVSLNEKQLLNFSRTYAGATIPEKLMKLPPVELILSDGSEYGYKGKVETVNGLINTETGSASFRAIFPNPAGLIRSGGSAAVKVPRYVEDVLLVPQKSTFEVQGKKFLYLVDGAGKIHSNEIEVEALTCGQLYVVKKGLKKGDRIVLEGTDFLKDGMQIKPEHVTAEQTYAALQ